jgi:hypothetical protein
MAYNNQPEFFKGAQLPENLHYQPVRIDAVDTELRFYQFPVAYNWLNRPKAFRTSPRLVSRIIATLQNPDEFDPELTLLALGNFPLKPGNLANFLYQDAFDTSDVNTLVNRAIEVTSSQPATGNLITLNVRQNTSTFLKEQVNFDGILIDYDTNLSIRQEE